MKIEIDEGTVTGVIVEVGAAAGDIVRRVVADLEEKELLREIRSNKALDAKAKVLAYLNEAKRGLSPDTWAPEDTWITVESEYVRKNLGIKPLLMRAIRDELEKIGDVIVERGKRIIMRHIQE